MIDIRLPPFIAKGWWFVPESLKPSNVSEPILMSLELMPSRRSIILIVWRWLIIECTFGRKESLHSSSWFCWIFSPECLKARMWTG